MRTITNGSNGIRPITKILVYYDTFDLLLNILTWH